MKNYTYYLLMYALGGSIGVGHAMNTGNEYSVTKLTLPLETLKTENPKLYKEYMKAEGDYHEAELKLKQARDDLKKVQRQAQDDLKKVQREVRPCTEDEVDNAEKNLQQAQKQFNEVKQKQEETRNKYKATEAFKKYHEEVEKVRNNKNQKYDELLDEPLIGYSDNKLLLYKKVLDIKNKRKQKQYQGKSNITVENPKTNTLKNLPVPDINSEQYKKITDKKLPHQEYLYILRENGIGDARKGSEFVEFYNEKNFYYSVLENKAYHDQLENLRIAKEVMEFSKKEVEEDYAKLSWLSKAWLNLCGRNTYKKDIAYHTQALSNLDNEIDSFIKEDYKKNQHKTRDAFSRSCMLRYAKNPKEAEELFKCLKLDRGEEYFALKSNNRSVNE